MKRFRPIQLLLLPVLSLSLAACDTPLPRRVAFNEADFAGYRGRGTATVTGKLVVSTEEGMKEGNGVSVELVPVNAYTEEMVEMELGQGRTLSPRVDARFKQYARIVTTDGNGNFTITGVPAGRYFLCGEVDWLPAAATDYSGQWALERISVAAGQTVHVTLSHNPNEGHGTEMIQVLR